MKYGIIILAFIGILAQSFNKMIIILNFELNKEYIAKNLCVQKDDKDNCCKGSCHLKEELEEEDQQQTPNAPDFKNKTEDQVFFQTISIPDLSERNFDLIIPVLYTGKKPISVSSSIFHPPQC